MNEKVEKEKREAPQSDISEYKSLWVMTMQNGTNMSVNVTGKY